MQRRPLETVMKKYSERSPSRPTLPPARHATPDSKRDPRDVALDEWLALQTLVDSLADAGAAGKAARRGKGDGGN
jgi:hypothetical protein